MRIRTFVYSILWLCNSIAFAQNDYFKVMRVIDVSQLNNMPFRINLQAKMNQLDDDAFMLVDIFVRGAQGQPLGTRNNASIESPEWKTFTLSGTIEDGAKELVISAFARFSGQFYLDDMSFSVKEGENDWVNIDIDNAGFESSTDDNKLNGWTSSFEDVSTPEIQLVEHITDSGNQALLIDRPGPFIGHNSVVGQSAQINGVEIYYETYGTGEPLLLLHGNGQSISAFAQHIPTLAKHYQVIAVDSRGQGKSTFGNTEASYRLMAEDMKQLLDHLKLDNINVLGWSDGGNTALLMAINYPDKVKKMAILGANLQPGDEYVHKETLDENIKFLERDDLKPSTRSLVEMLLKYPNIPIESLHTIKAPTLVMAGDHDVIRDEHTINIFQNIEKSYLSIFPAASHFIPFENPEKFTAAVLDFFNQPYREIRR